MWLRVPHYNGPAESSREHGDIVLAVTHHQDVTCRDTLVLCYERYGHALVTSYGEHVQTVALDERDADI